MRRTVVPGLCTAALVLAGCGSSQPASSPASTPTSSAGTALPARTGDGSANFLAQKLQADKLGCSDYKQVPEQPQFFASGGVRDVGSCDLGHLAVFVNALSRDKWIIAQLNVAKMGGCAEGSYWAVCVFPSGKYGKSDVQNSLNGFSIK
ncbi:MAG TPA: hypothetical protein VFA11_15395 [Acidimicrobiales bacterium]|nr:hypothetical protein [Acidimicrobiales bacterium]